MAYKCYDCGHIFENGEEKTWVENYGENRSGCPLCGGSYGSTVRCSICKSEHLDDELEGGVCEECIGQYRYNADVCYSIGEKSKEDVFINGFLASMYSAEEIEELIWRDMLNTRKIKAVDCKPFIEADVSWFAENLAEEVNKNENGKG